MKLVSKQLLGAGAALALTIAGLLPLSTNAAEEVKGGQKLMELGRIQSKQELQQLKPGDTIAVACPHCKMIFMTKVQKKGAEGLVTLQGDKVVCPKCGG